MCATMPAWSYGSRNPTFAYTRRPRSQADRVRHRILPAELKLLPQLPPRAAAPRNISAGFVLRHREEFLVHRRPVAASACPHWRAGIVSAIVSATSGPWSFLSSSGLSEKAAVGNATNAIGTGATARPG